MNENTEFSAEMLDLMDDKYIHDKAEILTHVVQGEGEDAHRKALNLLKNDSKDIDLILYAIAGSEAGGFFQDVIKYGNEALSWIHSNGKDLEKNNSLGWSTIDIREKMARSYFGLQDFSAAKNELNKITEEQGALPDTIKSFAIKNEYQLNGAKAAFDLADRLVPTFSEKEGEDFREFKLCETQICFVAIKALANNNITDFPRNMPIAQAQTTSKYLLRMVNSLEFFNEKTLSDGYKAVLAFGREWLVKVVRVLYEGGTIVSEGRAEIEINNHYAAAKDCIMVLEKLSDMQNGFAQYLLGQIYYYAYNVDSDPKKALKYYELAYANGMKGALINLASCYNEGVATKKDPEKALEYAKKAAEEGDVRAYGLLGQIYADSLKDVEQCLIWLRKAVANGDEASRDILLRLAKENIENFDEKYQFILDINERAQKDISSLDSQLEVGKRYVMYYMEIEKYYITHLERLNFLAFCQDAQPETLLKYGGFVSVDYFMEQFEKALQEMPDKRIDFIRVLAKRANSLIMWEMIPVLADGKDPSNLGWDSVCNYIYRKSNEWGWDGYLADGEEWDYTPLGNNAASQSSHQQERQPTMQNVPSNSSQSFSTSSGSSSGGCYVATAVYGSYDCPEVWVLRRFRDSFLTQNWCGRMFIKIYYTISPILVKWFGKTQWFNQFGKRQLDKLVAKLKMNGFEDSPYND